jgi:hypothetical protein
VVLAPPGSDGIPAPGRASTTGVPNGARAAGGALVQVSFAYNGRSAVVQPPGKRWQALSLVPNLTRDPVSFDAPAAPAAAVSARR